MTTKYQKYECDRCGLTCKKINTYKQDGLRVCKYCFDDKPKTKPLNMHWGQNRANSMTTTAVEESTVYDIVAGTGITLANSVDSWKAYSLSLGISNIPSYITFGNSYYQIIQGSGGAVDVSANPQIAAGSEGDRITLEGYSNTNTVLLENGTGLSMPGGSCLLKKGTAITFVYTNSLWREISRGETYK